MAEMSPEEQLRLSELAAKARQLICECFTVQAADDSSITAYYFGFYLQISFSALHPLILFSLARKQLEAVNDLNLRSILGTHTINPEVGRYAYRAVHWLDTELTRDRLFELLGRLAGEAQRGYERLRV